MKKILLFLFALVATISANAISFTVTTNNPDGVLFKIAYNAQTLTGPSTTFDGVYYRNGQAFDITIISNLRVDPADGYKLTKVTVDGEEKIISAAGICLLGAAENFDGTTIDVQVASLNATNDSEFGLTINGGANLFTARIGGNDLNGSNGTAIALTDGTQTIEYNSDTHTQLMITAKSQSDYARTTLTAKKADGSETVLTAAMQGYFVLLSDYLSATLDVTDPTLVKNEYSVTLTGVTAAVKSAKVGANYIDPVATSYTVTEGDEIQFVFDTDNYINISATVNGTPANLLGMNRNYIKFAPTADTEVNVSATEPADITVKLTVDNPDAFTFYRWNTSKGDVITGVTAGTNQVILKENHNAICAVLNPGYVFLNSTAPSYYSNGESVDQTGTYRAVLSAGEEYSLTSRPLAFDHSFVAFMSENNTVSIPALRFNAADLEMPEDRSNRETLAEGYAEYTFDSAMMPMRVVGIETAEEADIPSVVFLNDVQQLPGEDGSLIIDNVPDNSVLKVFPGRAYVDPVTVTITVTDGVEHVIVYDKIRKPEFTARPSTLALNPNEQEYIPLDASFTVLPPAHIYFSSNNKGTNLGLKANEASVDATAAGEFEFYITEEHRSGIHFDLYDLTITSLENVAVDANAPAEFFNLQGIRLISEPATGIYLRRQGQKVEKIVK